MKHDLPLAVVDTSVLIALFTNEQMEGRVDRAKALLKSHGNSCNIAIPALQELEFIAPATLGKGQLQERSAYFDEANNFLRSQQFISLELNQFVAQGAGRLYGRVADKRNDVALLAAAQFHQASAIYTFDRKFIRAVNESRIDVKAMEPPLGQAVLF